MSKNFEYLNEQLLAARKARNSGKAVMIATLKSEVERASPRVNGAPVVEDSKVLKVVNDAVKNTEANLVILDERGSESMADKTREELAWLKEIQVAITPKYMSDDELQCVVDATYESVKDTPKLNIGTILNPIKILYNGMYEPAKLTAMIKAKLA